MVTKVNLLGPNSAGEVVDYTISTSATATKYDLMILSSPRTIASHTTTVAADCVGVANADKEAADDSTKLGVQTNGIYEMDASGSINAGDQVITSSVANYVEASNSITNPIQIVGVALKDAASNKVEVRVLK